MKRALRTSIWLNLVFLGALVFILTKHNQKESVPAPVPSEAKSSPTAAVSPSPTPSRINPEPFRWSQLESSRNYRAYMANLRAIGCPETTIEDIVRGDTERTFSWERSQLGLDGSGAGPWSRQAEMRLVASLLSEKPASAGTVAAQSAENGTAENSGDNEAAQTAAAVQSVAGQAPAIAGGGLADTPARSPSAADAAPSYPLFLQNVNWNALGFTADQQAAIAQVRQQFLNGVNGLDQNSGNSAGPNSGPANQNALANSDNSASLTQWQTTLQNANDQLSASLGEQAYEAYLQQQYMEWYQPQVVAASAAGGQLTINPGAFSVK